MRRIRSSFAALSLLGFASCAPTPDGEPPGSHEAALQGPDSALIEVQASLNTRVAQLVQGMPSGQRAKFINTLAWYDQDPRQLYVARGMRGQVERLAGRLLAYPIEPDPPLGLDPKRIEHFFNAELGAELLALGPDDKLKVVRTRQTTKGAFRYILHQSAHGYRVDGAVLTADVDASGRLTRMTSSVIPDLQPPTGTLLSEGAARSVAEQAVLASGHFGWQGASSFTDVEPPSIRVAWTHPLTGTDEARFAWHFTFDRGDTLPAARTEVLIDALDGTALALRDHSRLMLDGRDQISQVDVVIGESGLSFGPGFFSFGGTPSPCASTMDPPPDPSMSSMYDRDLDEAQVALCEAVTMFQSYGGSLPGGWRSWIDPRGDGIHLYIDATPGVSVGMNTGRAQVFARGVARAEVIGHELFHSALGAASGVAFSHYRSGDHHIDGAEGAAVEEHLCDAFGTLLERRFQPHRNENTCLMNDDIDSMETQGMQDLDPNHPTFAYRFCADQMIAREWRSMCHPEQQNSGWCAGTPHYSSLAYNRYDAYGHPSGPTGHVASHTNLGIGNRVWAALLGEDIGDTRFVIQGTNEDTVTQLLFGLALEMGPGTDWAAYGYDMTAVARELDATGIAMGNLERQVRAGLNSVGIWSPSAEVIPQLSGTPQSIAPTALDRPAVASVNLTGDSAGRMRTFVFYRPSDDATTLSYVWRDEARSGESETLGESWTGPCTLSGAITRTGAAATGRQDGLSVVWAEPSATDPEVGILNGLTLTAEAATSGSGCNFSWTETDPPVERKVRGQPAIANWIPEPYEITCERLGATVESVGVIGKAPFDCWRIFDQSDPFTRKPIDDLGIPVEDWLIDLLNLRGPRFPSPFDPHGPRRTSGVQTHRVPVWPLVQGNTQYQAHFQALPEIGAVFNDAFKSAGSVRAMGVEIALPWEIVNWKNDVAQGRILAINLLFGERVPMVAFRDDAGVLRLAPYDDPRPTADLPIVETNPTSDPALAVTEQHIVSDDIHVQVPYLHVLYGTEEIHNGMPVPTRLSQRTVRRWELSSPFAQSDIDPAQRLDSFASGGNGRTIDYGFIRSLQAPVAVGDGELLHVFTVVLEHDEETFTPDPSAGRGGVVTQQRAPGSNRIRHAILVVHDDGMLSPQSERPVFLTRTSLSTRGFEPSDPDPYNSTDEQHPLNQTQAGAAILQGGRAHVRWFYPHREGLGVRTVHSP